MSLLWDLLGSVLSAVVGVARGIWSVVVKRVSKRPSEVVVLLIVAARLFGTTVQTGWWGVLFRFGRPRRVLSPGFTWLIPLVETVRTLPGRSITLDLAPQRLAIADGMAYEVSASLVYRIHDPVAALVEVNDVVEGCRNAAALALFEVLRTRTHVDLRDRAGIEDAFSQRARARLARWGVEVDRAGLTNIAPTPRTLRATQLEVLVRERAEALRRLRAGGLCDRDALGLLGATRRPESHAHARYRGRSRSRGAAGTRTTAPVLRGADSARRALARELIDGLVRDDLLAEGQVAAAGTWMLPFLYDRLRRTGDHGAQARIQAAIVRIAQEAQQQM